LTPKDTSITKLGGSELTAMDIQKIKKAYGCDGSCGARQKSETGGGWDIDMFCFPPPCYSIAEIVQLGDKEGI
jgi:hypothetical protein